MSGKSVICESYSIHCKRYQRQLVLVSKHSVLTHTNYFVDIKVFDFWRVVWPTLTNKLVLKV